MRQSATPSGDDSLIGSLELNAGRLEVIEVAHDTPSQVAEAANVTFSVTVSRQQVYRYNPDNPQPPAATG